MNPRSAIQGRLGARCRSVQALQEVQAGGLLRTAQWQQLPLPEPLHPASALWESQASNLQDELHNPVGLQWGEGENFRDSADKDGADGNGGGIHQIGLDYSPTLLIHFKRSHAII
jgi:hypothetical protein